MNSALDSIAAAMYVPINIVKHIYIYIEYDFGPCHHKEALKTPALGGKTWGHKNETHLSMHTQKRVEVMA